MTRMATKLSWLARAKVWCEDKIGQYFLLKTDKGNVQVKIESWKITEIFHHNSLELRLNNKYVIWLSYFPLPRCAFQVLDQILDKKIYHERIIVWEKEKDFEYLPSKILSLVVDFLTLKTLPLLLHYQPKAIFYDQLSTV